MKRKILGLSCLALALAFAAGCQDLDVINTNAPDRERALNNPADVEALVSSAYADAFARLHRSSSSLDAFPVIADEMSATYANSAALELSSEPRPVYNNDPAADASGLARWQWEDWYGVVANVNDGLGAVENGLEIVIAGEDHTDRMVLWAKFLQGMAHGYIGLLFDKAFIYTEDDLDKGVSDLVLSPYPEVLAAAIDQLDEAIAIAQANPSIVVPDYWMGPVGDLTSAEIIELSNSFAARFMVYGARTPEERAAVDWAEVERRVDAGVKADFIMNMDANSYWSPLVRRFIQNGTFVAWCDYKNCGVADTSGEYQKWLALPWPDRTRFIINTPDRRIHGAAGVKTKGKYFEYRDYNPFAPERGTYHHSHYQWERLTLHYNRPLPLIYKAEMDLFKAEARFFRGDAAGAAVLINKTRVANGELPPVTAAGVPGGPGACVPHKSLPTQTCGSLYDALMYERMMELIATDALRGYLDSRGFGRLSTGTFLQLPIPGRELATLGMEMYTFGGVGGEWAAQ